MFSCHDGMAAMSINMHTTDSNIGPSVIEGRKQLSLHRPEILEGNVKKAACRRELLLLYATSFAGWVDILAPRFSCLMETYSFNRFGLVVVPEGDKKCDLHPLSMPRIKFPGDSVNKSYELGSLFHRLHVILCVSAAISMTSWLDVCQNNQVIWALLYKCAGLLMGKRM